MLAAADAAGGLGYGQPAALLAMVREASSRIDKRLRQARLPLPPLASALLLLFPVLPAVLSARGADPIPALPVGC